MDARATLHDRLGRTAAVDALSDAEAVQVTELLAAAERDERQALDASIDVTLRHLPRLVRMPARRILFG
ncbi:MAG: hypothetical protein ACTHMS_01445 [Jatrophihabitans sp.]|uniref:hypothetical protein n=1 Tax=Jatrophihabitans sp. TaxID=1932789 RepID=UPI003F811FFD